MATGDPKEYYCDTCLRLRAELVWMTRSVKPPYGHRCDICGHDWPINQGNTRHYVSQQLEALHKLAEELGIPWGPF